MNYFLKSLYISCILNYTYIYTLTCIFLKVLKHKRFIKNTFLLYSHSTGADEAELRNFFSYLLHQSSGLAIQGT